MRETGFDILGGFYNTSLALVTFTLEEVSLARDPTGQALF